MELKTLKLTNEKGHRATKVCNGIKAQMQAKIKEVLEAAGFDVAVTATNELAIATAIDEATGETYYTRVATTLTAKDLNEKPERKGKAKVETAEAEEVVPQLFA